MVEGPQGVLEILKFRPDLVRGLYLTETAAGRNNDILGVAQKAGIEIQYATGEVLQTMSSNAQQVLVVAAMENPDFATWIMTEPKPKPKLLAILNNVRDPGNAGTIIRVADAFGANAVVLAGDCVEITNPKVVRSTAGSLFHLPVFSAPDLSEIIDQCHDAGVQVFAADGHGETELPTITLTNPTAWLFGNEAWGLPAADRALADAVVRIPMPGHAESLNLATAATVCLYSSALALA
ncbi:MAG: RNA methyltransferase [Cellulomonadaceae bacterium]|nr:RNA methyltransferase [Cellulomonadaceae bacterium]